jgi:hypothetical protein
MSHAARPFEKSLCKKTSLEPSFIEGDDINNHLKWKKTMSQSGGVINL